jgi:tRNA isopentenyl-2-thiomethyl-A-37 hydroxylase MiaE
MPESYAPPRTPAPPLPWRLDDIDLSAIDRERVRGDETLFFLLATSSFVEIASALYTRNLSAYYTADNAVLEWLNGHWEQEEIQHGRALRAYVQAVWPEFDWEAANTAFYADYGARCTLDEFEPTRALELAARCVVEMATATFYRTVHEYTDEPVLKTITGHIKSDEVRHYSYFWRFFEVYRAREQVGRIRVLRAIVRRVLEVANDDGLIAYRHAFAVRYPDRSFERHHYDAFQADLKRILRHHFPIDMSLKMLLKPLDLPAGLQRLVLPPARKGVGLLLA